MANRLCSRTLSSLQSLVALTAPVLESQDASMIIGTELTPTLQKLGPEAFAKLSILGDFLLVAYFSCSEEHGHRQAASPGMEDWWFAAWRPLDELQEQAGRIYQQHLSAYQNQKNFIRIWESDMDPFGLSCKATRNLGSHLCVVADIRHLSHACQSYFDTRTFIRNVLMSKDAQGYGSGRKFVDDEEDLLAHQMNRIHLSASESPSSRPRVTVGAALPVASVPTIRGNDDPTNPDYSFSL